jgi:hypothetical protein
LHREIATERQYLHRELGGYAPLLKKCRIQTPDLIERAALGALLHSFYNGLENIFKRIAMACDGGLPEGSLWHRRLLDSMAQARSNRPAALSEETHKALRAYADFRHLFRHGYLDQLNWELMADAVHGIPATLERVEADLDRFLAALKEDN